MQEETSQGSPGRRRGWKEVSTRKDTGLADSDRERHERGPGPGQEMWSVRHRSRGPGLWARFCHHLWLWLEPVTPLSRDFLAPTAE